MITAREERISLDRVTKELIQKIITNIHRARPVVMISTFNLFDPHIRL